MKKINWDNLAWWIILIVFIIVIVYLFATGRAWK